MKKPTFDNIQDVKEWAEKLEFINQLPKEDYEKFKDLYGRIMFFDGMFDSLYRLHRNMRQAATCYEKLKSMVDSGDLARAVELSKKITEIVGEDY